MPSNIDCKLLREQRDWLYTINGKYAAGLMVLCDHLLDELERESNDGVITVFGTNRKVYDGHTGVDVDRGTPPVLPVPELDDVAPNDPDGEASPSCTCESPTRDGWNGCLNCGLPR